MSFIKSQRFYWTQPSLFCNLGSLIKAEMRFSCQRWFYGKKQKQRATAERGDELCDKQPDRTVSREHAHTGINNRNYHTEQRVKQRGLGWFCSSLCMNINTSHRGLKPLYSPSHKIIKHSIHNTSNRFYQPQTTSDNTGQDHSTSDTDTTSRQTWCM